jgi:hypothetical protein
VKLTSQEVSFVSIGARQRGLPPDYVERTLRAHGASRRALRLVRAIRKIESGEIVAGETGRLAGFWVQWVDAMTRRAELREAARK